jgi:hypothetical protein
MGFKSLKNKAFISSCGSRLRSNSRIGRLRNPRARFPEPHSVFNLVLASFVPAYRGIITAEQ